MHVLAAAKLVSSYWRKLAKLLLPADGVEYLAPLMDEAVADFPEYDEDENDDDDDDGIDDP
jgi:hypothetical protein